MRPLIRPTLFAIARLGLFLSVAAWVVGQFFYIRIASGVVIHKGIIVVSPELRHVLEFEVSRRQEIEPAISEFFEPDYVRSTYPGSVHVRSMPGVVYLMPIPPVDFGAIAVRHWLMVTVFIAFNLILHFIYRKRPEAQPCDS